MGLGDSANWNGTLPAILAVSAKSLEWRVSWQGRNELQSLKCVVRLFAGANGESVATAVAKAWNDENPEGRQAEYDRDYNKQQIYWYGSPDKMEFRVFDTGTAPSGPFLDVPYGNMVTVHEDLRVFRA